MRKTKLILITIFSAIFFFSIGMIGLESIGVTWYNNGEDHTLSSSSGGAEGAGTNGYEVGTSGALTIRFGWNWTLSNEGSNSGSHAGVGRACIVTRNSSGEWELSYKR